MEMKTTNRGIGRLSMHVRQFFGNRSGVSALEYALLVVAVLTLAAGGVTVLTGGFKTLFTETKTALEGATKATTKEAEKVKK